MHSGRPGEPEDTLYLKTELCQLVVMFLRRSVAQGARSDGKPVQITKNGHKDEANNDEKMQNDPERDAKRQRS